MYLFIYFPIYSFLGYLPAMVNKDAYLPDAERLKYMDLPTLRFRCRGDMIETYNLLTNKYDKRNGLPSLQFSLNGRTIEGMI